MPTPSEAAGPSPADLAAVYGAEDPVSAMFGILPDAQLLAMRDGIAQEIERRGLA